MTSRRREEFSKAARGVDPRQWVRDALESNKTLHSGHRAMLFLLVNEARNEWEGVSDRSVTSTLSKSGYKSGGSVWVSWYSLASQASILNVSVRHTQTLVDDLLDAGMISELRRPGRTSILIFDTRTFGDEVVHPGTTEPESQASDSSSLRNHGVTDPGPAESTTPEVQMRRSNREDIKRTGPKRIEEDQIDDVINDVVDQIRRYGRDGLSRVTFSNPLTGLVTKRLGWKTLCNQSEYEMRHQVRSAARQLLNEESH
jgi:hypothetical protein